MFRKAAACPAQLCSCCGFAALSSCGAAAAPRAFRGRPSTVPPSWKAFPAVGATAPSSRERKKGPPGCLCTSCDFCPFPLAKPDRKGHVRSSFTTLRESGERGGPSSPLSSPREWPPCFLNTKWRHVARVRRQRATGASTKALECAPLVASRYPVPVVGDLAA